MTAPFPLYRVTCVDRTGRQWRGIDLSYQLWEQSAQPSLVLEMAVDLVTRDMEKRGLEPGEWSCHTVYVWPPDEEAAA